MDNTVLAGVIEILGRVLVHSAWQGALVGLLYAATMLCLHRATPRRRYAAAVVWLAVFALCPLVTLAVLVLSPAASGATAAGAWLAAPPAGDAMASLLSNAPLLVSLWLAGVTVLGLRLLWHWRRAGRLTYLECQPMGERWDARLQALAEQMGVRRAVSLMESAIVPVPTVIGWLKPVILIPSSALLGLTQRQLELIIAHELAHISRYDCVVNYLLLAVETLCFYHPVVHVIGRGIRNEREMCCDDLVLRHFGRRVEYVTALTDLETLRSSHVLTEPLSNLSATGGDLLHRVQYIVKGCAPRAWALHVTTIAAALTVLAGSALLAGEPAATGRAVQAAPPVLSEPLALRMSPAAPASRRAAPVAQVLEPDVLRAALAITAPPTAPVWRAEAEVDAIVADTWTVPVDLPQPDMDLGGLADLPRGAVRGREREGPTHAMISELDLAPPMLSSLSDLQRDASRALAVAQSPYVVVAPTVDHDFVVRDIDDESVREEGGALIRRIEPRYPSRARMRGYTDTVQVEFIVTDTGEVSDIQIVSTNSRAAFERAVIRAVKKWRYEPLLRDGIPVERRIVETFAFRLSGPQDPERGIECSRDRNSRFACTSRGLSRIL